MTRSGSTEDPVRYRIEHVSRFLYDSPVRRCTMSLCLEPLESDVQRLLDFSIKTSPPARITTETDPFGNTRHLLSLHQDHSLFEVVSASTVEIHPSKPLPDHLDADAWNLVRAWRNDPRWWDFTHPSAVARPSPALDRFVRRLGIEFGVDPLIDVLALSTALNEAFIYTPGATSVDSPIDDILTSGKGVCQDYAHVLVAIARSWGLPTRYVSGYLYVTGDGESGNLPVAAASHAWAECRLPGLGWVGVDPTNRAVVDLRYIRVAVGRDYRDVPPTRGVVEGGGSSRLDVEVRIEAA